MRGTGAGGRALHAPALATTADGGGERHSLSTPRVRRGRPSFLRSFHTERRRTWPARPASKVRKGVSHGPLTPRLKSHTLTCNARRPPAPRRTAGRAPRGAADADPPLPRRSMDAEGDCMRGGMGVWWHARALAERVERESKATVASSLQACGSRPWLLFFVSLHYERAPVSVSVSLFSLPPRAPWPGRGPRMMTAGLSLFFL